MQFAALDVMFMRYLFFPLMAGIMAVVYGVLRKKNALLQNRKVIVFVLLSALVLGLPGFAGLLGVNFGTGVYLAFQAMYVVLGMIFLRMLLRRVSEKATKYKRALEASVTLIVMLIAMYVFSLLFNLFDPLKGGLWAATCVVPLLVPLLFHWSYQAFLDVPPEIYKVWQYSYDRPELDLDGIDFNRLMVLEVEFSRRVMDESLVKVKAKAPAGVSYGDWFQKFINDYNFKFPENIIQPTDEYQQPYSWIFYMKPSFFRSRRYLDPDLTIADNKVQEAKTIVCKRVIQHTEPLPAANSLL